MLASTIGLRPELGGTSAGIWVGCDASVRHDSTAIACCMYDTGSNRVRLVWHRIFQPSPSQPLDFEKTIEATLRELHRNFKVREIRFDPYQMIASAQRLTAAGLPMLEFPQSIPNLTLASQNLYDLIRSHSLVTYPDPDIRLAMSRATASESDRGWHITKRVQSHKIDIIIALAQAALGAAQGGAIKPDFSYTRIPMPPRTGPFDTPRPSPVDGTGYWSSGDSPMWCGSGEALASAEDSRSRAGVGAFTSARWRARYGRGW